MLGVVAVFGMMNVPVMLALGRVASPALRSGFPPIGGWAFVATWQCVKPNQ
jgi:hypothetical protein